MCRIDESPLDRDGERLSAMGRAEDRLEVREDMPDGVGVDAQTAASLSRVPALDPRRKDLELPRGRFRHR